MWFEDGGRETIEVRDSEEIFIRDSKFRRLESEWDGGGEKVKG